MTEEQSAEDFSRSELSVRSEYLLRCLLDGKFAIVIIIIIIIQVISKKRIMFLHFDYLLYGLGEEN